MKKIYIFAFLIWFSFIHPSQAGLLDDFLGGFKNNPITGGQLTLDTTIKGLKEALSIGSDNAVSLLSKNEGYLSNEAVKILMPEKIQNVADMLSKIGYQKQVDSFIQSMNQAAEKAAPQAKEHFLNAIKQMSFEDAKGILNGSNTAATDYLKTKTSQKIFDSFKPIITSSLNQVGGTQAYNTMMEKFNSIPFATSQSFDLNNYVTDNALKGMFYMIGREEEKIRTDPAARVTDVLKKVFSK